MCYMMDICGGGDMTSESINIMQLNWMGFDFVQVQQILNIL